MEYKKIDGDMAAQEPQAPACRGILHKVKEGDSLYSISQMHHIPLRELMFANPYVDVYHLQPGDEICVPVAKSLET
jgi:hypothetical protein